MVEFERDGSLRASSLVDVLRRRAEGQADRTAYIWLRDGEEIGAELSYSELDRRARSVAAALQGRMHAGDRALLLYPPGLAFIAAFFGCLYAGVINVPTYPPQVGRRNQTAERIQNIASQTEPLVLTSSKIFASKEKIVAEAPELGHLQWLNTDAINADRAEGWVKPHVTDSTLALLQFTSGSTGLPKGTMISHGNLMSNLELMRRSFGCDRESCAVIWLPPYHDMGLIGGLLLPLFTGFPVVLMSPVSFLQHPIRWPRAISRFRATISGGPNFAYELCLRRVKAEHKAELDLGCWKIAFNGSEPVRANTIASFVEAFAVCGFRREAFYPCYGLAESTLMVSGSGPLAGPVIRAVHRSALAQGRVVEAAADDSPRDVQQLVASGHCAPGHRIAIVDPKTETRCPPGQVGEIWIAGPSVARGYWRRAGGGFGARQAGEGGFFRTGDLGFLKNHELFVTGRLKDLIIISGRNHYPQDIERTVEHSHPTLQPNACAVFSVDVGGQEQVIVLLETPKNSVKKPEESLGTRPGIETDAAELTRRIRQEVAEVHDLPVHEVRFLEVGSLPKTTSGKLRRYLCKLAFLAGEYDQPTKRKS